MFLITTGEIEIRGLLRDVFFVPDTKDADDLLRGDFEQKGILQFYPLLEPKQKLENHF